MGAENPANHKILRILIQTDAVVSYRLAVIGFGVVIVFKLVTAN